MIEEKRKGDTPIPINVKNYLNEAQLAELRSIEKFGWSLKYIRRPLFQDLVIVVSNPDGRSIGTLEDDGGLNMEPKIETRE